MVGLLVVALALIGAKYCAWQQTSHLMEQALEVLMLRITAQLRQAELLEIEALDQADVYLKMLNAQKITEMAVRSVDLGQAAMTLTLSWMYLFTLSPHTGLSCL